MRQIRQWLSLTARTVRSAGMTMALLVAGAITTGCTHEDNAIDDGQPANEARTYTLTTTVSLDGGAQTRTLNPSTGEKTFAEGDKIAVKYWKKNKSWACETAISNELTISADGKTATFTVTLDDPDPGKTEVRYVYPAYLESDNERAHILETEQDGTLTTLQSKFDYSEGSGNIDHSGATPALPTLTLENKLAIAILDFTDGTNTIANVNTIAIHDGTHEYIVKKPTTSTEEKFYVALLPIGASQTITIGATTQSSSFYEKSFTGKPLEANNIYPITATLDVLDNDRSTPLTLEAKEEEGAKVTFTLSGEVTSTVEYRTYSTSSGTWDSWNSYTSGNEITLAAMGDKVCFRGSNATYNLSTISCDNNCYVYGNVMSLISPKDFPFTTRLTENSTFPRLFNNNTHLYSHNTRILMLPATTLTSDCYQHMFSGCSNLTKAPALPATKMESHCYEHMFSGCSSLTAAPALNATTLETKCYKSMFSYCTSLTTAPALPATTLSDGCYQEMFSSCKNLKTAPVLSADKLKSSCYQDMFYDCNKLHSVTMLASDPDYSDRALNDWLQKAGTDGGTGGTVYINPSLNSSDPLYEYLYEYIQGKLWSGWSTAPYTP